MNASSVGSAGEAPWEHGAGKERIEGLRQGRAASPTEKLRGAVQRCVAHGLKPIKSL